MKKSTEAFTRFHVSGLLIAASCLMSSVALAQYSPPSSGLIAWWRGDGNASDSADSHNGTLQGGMGFTTGLYNQAFASGSNKRVFVPDSVAFQLSSLTMGAWINIDAASYVVLFRGDSRAGYDAYQMGLQFGGPLEFSMTDTNNNSVGINATVPYHQWVQVTSTFDGTTGDMRLYVNGSLAAQTTTLLRPILALDPAASPGISIGNVIGGDFPLLGAIDEVVLYNRALSPAEVLQLAPEPSSMALLGLAGAMLFRIRRSKNG
jgi:hypothetical protein